MEKSVLDIEVSQFKDYYDKVPVKPVNLLEWLRDDSQKEKVERIRALDNKTAKDKVKATLPCITVSGLFSTRSKAGLTKHSGLICIDIDYKGNEQIENYGELKRILSTAPFVAFCGLSVSGAGYFVIIPIKYPEQHEMQFEALHRMYEGAGIEIDISCKDVSRLRGYSWDYEAYINHYAKTFDKVYQEPEPVKPIFRFKKYKTTKGTDNRVRVEKYINEITVTAVDITDNYNNWYKIGLSLASEFGEAGRQYFHDVSRYYSKYSYEDADKKFTGLLKSNAGKIKIGTFFYQCRAHGIKP